MSARYLRPLFASLLCFVVSGFVSVQRAEAQVLYGTIVGTVTDQSAAVLPGVQVTATNEGTGL